MIKCLGLQSCELTVAFSSGAHLSAAPRWQSPCYLAHVFANIFGKPFNQDLDDRLTEVTAHVHCTACSFSLPLLGLQGLSVMVSQTLMPQFGHINLLFHQAA